MSIAASTIALSLVSHTNVGKTTLARTLIGADVGEIRDAPHVTEVAEAHTMIETREGDRLALWDTPGFGDSARLADRLARSGTIGWLLSEVWDRFTDRPFWSSQQAVRNVRDEADVVLYLVSAAEDPADAGYVAPEMRILEWIGKPVIVLLNQVGRPRPRAEEAAEERRWQEHLAGKGFVRSVLALDAFARCWVQEMTLLRAVDLVLPEAKRAAFGRLADAWRTRRLETFDHSMDALARQLALAACDREPVEDEGLRGKLREVGTALGVGRERAQTPKERAMRRLAERLDAEIRDATDRLIAIHGLTGRAAGKVLERMAASYALRERMSEGKAAVIGGIVTGALAGLKADLAAGGMTFGAGLLAGGVLGALGAAGLARGYNLVRGADRTEVRWAPELLDTLVGAALLRYLAVAHYGRGRGEWSESESPAFWKDAVDTVLAGRSEGLAALWAERGAEVTTERIQPLVAAFIAEAGLEVLDRLYPGTLAAEALSWRESQASGAA